MLALAGCYPPGAPRTVAFTTDHFAYYSDDPVCPTLGDWMETDYSATRAFLGLEAKDTDNIRYFDYGRDADLTDACGDERGCYDRPDVVSGESLQRDVLAFAYGDDLGSPPAFFQYGLAGLLGTDSGGDDDRVDHTTDIGPMIRGDTDFSELDAAFFTRFLMDQFGLDTYLGFYASAGPAGDPSEKFEQAFGATVDDVVSDWAAAPSEHRGDDYLRVPECASARVAVTSTSGPVTVSPDLTCDQIGLDANFIPGQVGAYSTVEVTEGEALHLTVRTSATGWTGVEIVGCDGYAGDAQVAETSGDASTDVPEIWTALDPGLYYLDLIEGGDAGAATGSGTTEMDVEEGKWPMGGSCATAGDLTVGSDTPGVRLEGPAGDGELNVWLNATSAVDLVFGPNGSINFVPALTATSASLCTGTCDDLVCDSSFWQTPALFSAPSQVTLAAGQRALLRMEFPANTHAWVDLVRP